MRIDDVRPRKLRAGIKFAELSRLRGRSFLAAPLLGTAPAVVSLTSYGERLKTVSYAIESVGRASVRPMRLLLWVSDPDFDISQHPMLQRQVSRGLEIRTCPDYGPHKKSFPYCQESRVNDLPLLTIDDDMLYPPEWLNMLLAAERANPDTILGFRGHRIALGFGQPFAPYSTWRPAPDDRSSYRHLATGVAGILIPTQVQKELRDRDTEFIELCPRADDIWVHQNGVRAGVRTRIVGGNLRGLAIPRTQSTGLHHTNVGKGHNDEAIARTYTSDDISRIAAD